MSFDRMQCSAARTQLRLLGGVLGTVIKSNEVYEKILILHQRNVEVVTEGGLRTEYRDIASLLAEEVGELTRGDKLEVGEAYIDVSEVLSDDGYVVKVAVRG